MTASVATPGTEMPISEQNKLNLIDALERTKSKARRLVLTLHFQNRTTEARQVQRRARKLTKQIDELLSAAMEDWLGSAKMINDHLSRTNVKLQSSIRNIQKKKNVEDNVIKVLLYLDDVIETAISLIG
jgi:hypothetical protein